MGIEFSDFCEYICKTYCKGCIDQGRDLKGVYCLGCYHGVALRDWFEFAGMSKTEAKQIVRTVTHGD